MKLLQEILHFMHQHFFCWHNWKRLVNHGLPGEPDLSVCIKCGLITETFIF